MQSFIATQSYRAYLNSVHCCVGARGGLHTYVFLLFGGGVGVRKRALALFRFALRSCISLDLIYVCLSCRGAYARTAFVRTKGKLYNRLLPKKLDK